MNSSFARKFKAITPLNEFEILQNEEFKTFMANHCAGSGANGVI